MRLIVDNSLVSSTEIAKLLGKTTEHIQDSIEILRGVGLIQTIDSDGVSFVSASNTLVVAVKASPTAFRIIRQHWDRIEFCLSGEDQQGVVGGG